MDVLETDDLIITCKSGVTIRTRINAIREAGRATQGVKLIRLDDGDEIAATSKIGDQGEEDDATASSDAGDESSSSDAGDESSSSDAGSTTSSDETTDNTTDNTEDSTTEA
jgi:DNA gyrase subunit A